MLIPSLDQAYPARRSVRLIRFIKMYSIDPDPVRARFPGVNSKNFGSGVYYFSSGGNVFSVVGLGIPALRAAGSGKIALLGSPDSDPDRSVNSRSGSDRKAVTLTR